MKKYIVILLLVIAVVVTARLSLYTVDAAEYVYVTVLGQPVATFDGAAADNGAGLKIGWPWPIQQAQRVDRRLQIFDMPEIEQLTKDREDKTVDKMLVLRKPTSAGRIRDRDGVDRFIKGIGNADKAKAFLAARVNGKLGAAFGNLRMDDLISIADDPQTGKKLVDVTTEHLRQQLLDALRQPLSENYGIDLIDIRLSRFNHPINVRASIFARIQSERAKKVAEYQSDGDLQSKNILSKADQEVREKLAQARSEEEAIKADADTQASKIRNQAYSQDREFYEFLKTMEKLQNIVGGENTRLLLSTHRPMFELMFNPPRMKTGDKK